MGKLWSVRKFQARNQEANWIRQNGKLEAYSEVDKDGTVREYVSMKNKFPPLIQVLRLDSCNHKNWAKLPGRYVEALEEIDRLQKRVSELERPHWDGNPELVSVTVAEELAEAFYERLREMRRDPSIIPWKDAWGNRAEYKNAMYQALVNRFTPETKEQTNDCPLRV